jgi:hypothetical protein
VDKNLIRFADLPAGALFSHREYGGRYRKLAASVALPEFAGVTDWNTSWAWGTDGHGATGYSHTDPEELVRPLNLPEELFRWSLRPPVK